MKDPLFAFLASGAITAVLLYPFYGPSLFLWRHRDRKADAPAQSNEKHAAK